MVEPHLLILARRGDPAVRTLRQQAARRLMHASVADLSRVGWKFVVGHPDRASACVAGRGVPVAGIAAVLCRIHSVLPGDLQHLHEDDRAYAAAEMTAFLRAWLGHFPGTRFNEPTWTSLAGPAWHPLQWTWIAARLGVPVSGGSQPEHDVTTVIVVGEEAVGFSDPTLVDYALRIARAARSRLLSLQFVRDDGWRFHSADVCPQLDANSAAAVLRLAFERAPSDSGPPCEAREGVPCSVV
jgi:hypothetical protein